MGLVAQWHVGSTQSRDWTPALAGGFFTTEPPRKPARWILNHWTIREIPKWMILVLSSLSSTGRNFLLLNLSLLFLHYSSFSSSIQLTFFFFFRAGDVFSLFSFHFGLSFNSGSILFNLLSILHRSLENADHNSKIFEHKPPGWLKLLPSSLRSNIVLYRKSWAGSQTWVCV